MGRIADTAKSITPIAWDALSTDPRVGDSTLAARDVYIQSLLFGSELTDLEQAALNNLVVEFAATRLCIEAIDIGIEFWMVQSETETTQQPVEVTSFPMRLDHLKEQKKALLTKLIELEPIVAPLIPDVFERASGSRPLLSSIDDDLLTSNPQDFGPTYAPPET